LTLKPSRAKQWDQLLIAGTANFNPAAQLAGRAYLARPIYNQRRVRRI
jgi:hypothetical protein